MKKEKFVMVCPKCTSPKIKVDFSNPVVWAYGANPKYICMKCGYKGVVFPEIGSKTIKKYKKRQIEKKSKQNKILQNNKTSEGTKLIVVIWVVLSLGVYFLGGVIGVMMLVGGLALIRIKEKDINSFFHNL